MIFLVFTACGKKAPPFLSQSSLSISVSNLAGEWDKGEIILKGSVLPSLESGETEALVKGARAYYTQYSSEDAPCTDCPIPFHGYDVFDQGVIVEENFLCRMPGDERGQVYFYKVHLIGAVGAMGPPSNTVRVVVE